MEAYILGSAKTIATKLISLIGKNESIKVTGVEFLKPHVQFRPNCEPKLLKLESQYLLERFFFKLSMIRHNEKIKITGVTKNVWVIFSQ